MFKAQTTLFSAQLTSLEQDMFDALSESTGKSKAALLREWIRAGWLKCADIPVKSTHLNSPSALHNEHVFKYYRFLRWAAETQGAEWSAFVYETLANIERKSQNGPEL